MDPVRRLATDPPARSAALDVGPHLLGRIYAPDPRDWSVARLLEVAVPSGGRRVQAPVPPGDAAPAWELRTQLDQGQTGHCVGFGWTGWMDALPVEGFYQNADAHALYYECKVIDGEPGAEDGSTVRSGALAVRDRGRLAAFAFAATTTEVDDWIDHSGTVVVGTSWTDDMFQPDAQGYVRPTGRVAGGHCYVMLDRLDAEDAFLFQNSWGAGWGQHGRFRMRRADFAGLLADQGEACVAAELPH